MLIRPYKVSDVRDYFIGAKQGGGYGRTIDKTGVQCIELIGDEKNNLFTNYPVHFV